MTRVHVYHEDAERIRAAILRAAPTREVIAWTTRAQLRAGLADVELLFAQAPPRDGWEGATRLKLIQTMAAGIEHFLPSPSLPPSVCVTSVRGAFAPEVSEHGIGMMLALVRGWSTLIERQQAHDWRPFASRGLAGETACVLGVGEIGSRIARAAAGLEMRVIGVARHPRALPHFDEVIGTASWLEALHRTRVLFVTAPLTPETTHLVDERALAALPQGALVVALSRGEIVDEEALLRALKSGHLGGAALDVFETEPLPPEHPLWDAPNTLITPHQAGLGLRFYTRTVTVLLDNVERLERGLPLKNLVNRALGY